MKDEKIKYRFVLFDGSLYTTYEFQEDFLFLNFIDIKGTKRRINKTNIKEMYEVRENGGHS